LVCTHTLESTRFGGWGQKSSALADEGSHTNNRGKNSTMAKKFKDFIAHERLPKKTSIGRSPKMSSMNKSKKRSWKKYNKQGKV
jgi:hypothetical protein